MIFYNSDGSVQFESNENDFGWPIIDKCQMYGCKSIPLSTSKNNLFKKIIIEHIYNNKEIGHVEEITKILLSIDTLESRIQLSIINTGLYNFLEDNHFKQTWTSKEKLPFSSKKNSTKFSVKNSNLRSAGTHGITDIDKIDKIWNVSSVDNDKVFIPYDFSNTVRPGSEYDKETPRVLEGPVKKDELLAYIGLTRDIDKTLQKFFDETREMHAKVQEISECFLVMNAQIDQISASWRKLQSSKFEEGYLEDLLNMLQDNLPKVRRNWPFKILTQATKENSNFII